MVPSMPEPAVPPAAPVLLVSPALPAAPVPDWPCTVSSMLMVSVHDQRPLAPPFGRALVPPAVVGPAPVAPALALPSTADATSNGLWLAPVLLAAELCLAPDAFCIELRKSSTLEAAPAMKNIVSLLWRRCGRADAVFRKSGALARRPAARCQQEPCRPVRAHF